MPDHEERNIDMLLQHAYVHVPESRIEAALERLRGGRRPAAPRRATWSLAPLAAAAALAVAALWMINRDPGPGPSRPTLPAALPGTPQDPPQDELAALDAEIAKKPSDPALLLRRAAKLAALGRNEEVQRDLAKALVLKPDYVDALVFRGTWMELQEHDRRQDLDRALELDPRRVDAYLARARLLLPARFRYRRDAEGRSATRVRWAMDHVLESIRADCAKVLLLEPGQAEARLLRIESLLLQGDPEKDVTAARELRELMDGDPKNAAARLLRVRMDYLGAPAAGDRIDPQAAILDAALAGLEVEPGLLAFLEDGPKGRLLEHFRAKRALHPDVRGWLQEAEDRARIDRDIDALGSEDPKAREAAEASLGSFGRRALPALRRAIYHRHPDVRILSKEVADRLEARCNLDDRIAGARRAVEQARAMWRNRSFEDLVQDVRSLFQEQHLHLAIAIYVPRRTVGKQLLVEGQNSKGRVNQLTPEVVAALDKDPGMLFFSGGITDPPKPAPFGEVLLFTLPDEKGWTAYVVVTGLKGD